MLHYFSLYSLPAFRTTDSFLPTYFLVSRHFLTWQLLFAAILLTHQFSHWAPFIVVFGRSINSCPVTTAYHAPYGHLFCSIILCDIHTKCFVIYDCPTYWTSRIVGLLYVLLNVNLAPRRTAFQANGFQHSYKTEM